MEEILKKVSKIDYYINWYTTQVCPGSWFSVYKGGGLEFDKISRYDLGENPRWINWAATARIGGQHILKNTYIEERELYLILVVDLSKSMEFGSERVSKRRLAAEIAATLAYSAWRVGDPIGLIGYTVKIEIHLKPQRQKAYNFLIPQNVLSFQTQHGTQGKVSSVFESLPAKRALVFWLSDFLEELAEIKKALKVMGSRHDVIPVVLHDPRERELPQYRGGLRLRDLETGMERMLWFTKKNRATFHAEAKKREEDLNSLFKQLNLDYLWIDPKTDYLLEITKLFLSRRRRRS
jgi:uncharacterized protein (DUF58 family)